MRRFFAAIAIFGAFLSGCAPPKSYPSVIDQKQSVASGLPVQLADSIRSGSYVCDADGGIESSFSRVEFLLDPALAFGPSSIVEPWRLTSSTATTLTFEHVSEDRSVRLEGADGLYVRGQALRFERCS
jgi:hypothetical protein